MAMSSYGINFYIVNLLRQKCLEGKISDYSLKNVCIYSSTLIRLLLYLLLVYFIVKPLIFTIIISSSFSNDLFLSILLCLLFYLPLLSGLKVTNVRYIISMAPGLIITEAEPKPKLSAWFKAKERAEHDPVFALK